MNVDNHISYKKEFIKKRANTLIITPIYLNYEFLSKHLELLSKQTIQNFDVILVLNVVTDEKRVMEVIDKQKPKYGIVMVKRNEDNGSSGGFFVGEVYALENNYSLVIYAEDDCLPEDANLISEIVDNSKKNDFGSAKVKLKVDDNTWLYGGGLHMYSYVKTNVLRKTGLHYPPIYLGADDTEIGTKIVKIVGTPNQIKCEVSHPHSPPLFTNFKRSLLYRVNHILFHQSFLNGLWNFVVLDIIYVIFGSRTVRKAGATIVSNVLAFRFGKEALETFDGDVGLCKNEEEFQNKITITAKNEGYLYNVKEKKFVELFRAAKYLIRKEILIYPAPHELVLLSMLLAKKTYIASKKGCWLMSDNSNLFLHLIKWVLFVGFLPMFILFGLVVLVINTFRKPKTWRYGLD
ncbi:MAG: hypothetical protein ABID61_01475 [Candidatus Micrarchaeota archaeon]